MTVVIQVETGELGPVLLFSNIVGPFSSEQDVSPGDSSSCSHLAARSFIRCQFAEQPAALMDGDRLSSSVSHGALLLAPSHASDVSTVTSLNNAAPQIVLVKNLWPRCESLMKPTYCSESKPSGDSTCLRVGEQNVQRSRDDVTEDSRGLRSRSAVTGLVQEKFPVENSITASSERMFSIYTEMTSHHQFPPELDVVVTEFVIY
ncbi:unnamed protein product [Pleuronectes platessa]|uniref:Uncharacterized protein n=1 Tax=Pleuronectes platessa TaxID=8262 RepID=A0A9N7UAD5_PLEPL|nr:unnamed protein product [Pleuronectes platessa]